jgi:hypothetical protein
MIIHLLAPKDQSKWPKIWHHCHNIWKTSPYEIKMWNDEDIDQLLKEDDEEFFKDYLSNLKPIFKWDYVRPLILKKFGGAYFDMDVEIFFNFLPQLNPNIIYIVGGHTEVEKREIVQNSIMISYLNEMSFNFWNDIQQYFKYNVKTNFLDCKEPYSRIIKDQIVIDTVGPYALSRFVKANEHMSPPVEILDANIFNRGPNTIRFSFHHQTGAWK